MEACERGNLVPVFRRIFSDHLTPVLAYCCLLKEDDREAPSFLFESVENGQTTVNVVSSTKFSQSFCLQAREHSGLWFVL